MTFSTALDTAVTLRIPVFEREVPPKQRIDELADYMLLTAYWQGEMNAERLDLLETLKTAQHEWDHLEGWEPHRRNKTEAGVNDAKRQLRPDLYDQMKDLSWKVKRLVEEHERLERDATKTSRVYSMMTGT